MIELGDPRFPNSHSVIQSCVPLGQPCCGHRLYNHLLGNRDVHCSSPQYWRVNWCLMFKWRLVLAMLKIRSIHKICSWLMQTREIYDQKWKKKRTKTTIKICQARNWRPRIWVLWLSDIEQNCSKKLSTIAAKYWPLVLVSSNRNCPICGKFGKIANFAFISATNTPPQT